MKKDEEKIGVINIVGRGRSGSTLLEYLLSTKFRAVPIGELRLICMLHRDEHKCSCGRILLDCPRWSSIFARLESQFEDLPAELQELKKVMHKRNFLYFFIPFRSTWLRKKFNRQIILLSALYESISTEFDTKLIVDSSKNPFYSLIISETAKTSVDCLHLIRDPRAVWYSWVRQKTRPQNVHLYRRNTNILTHSFAWLFSNWFAGLLKREDSIRYSRVTYESLIENTETLDTLIGGNWRSAEGVVQNIQSHSLSGNPVRFSMESMKIIKDDEWLSKLSKTDSTIVSVITYVLHRKYYGSAKKN